MKARIYLIAQPIVYTIAENLFDRIVEFDCCLTGKQIGETVPKLFEPMRFRYRWTEYGKLYIGRCAFLSQLLSLRSD